MSKEKVEFAYYKGDNFIKIDTAGNLAKELGVKVETIYFYSYPTNIKRIGKDSTKIVTVRLDD